jgi:hypothetical protein
MITKEWLLEQLQMYRTQKDNALGMANANQGAIEAIEAVLKQLEEKPKVKESK